MLNDKSKLRYMFTLGKKNLRYKRGENKLHECSCKIFTPLQLSDGHISEIEEKIK